MSIKHFIIFWREFKEIINLKINSNNPAGNEFAKVKIWTSRWHSVFMNLPFASSAHISDKLSAGVRNIVYIQHNFKQNTTSDTLIYLINVGRAKNRNYPVCWVADSSWRPKFVVSRNYGVLVVYVVVPGPESAGVVHRFSVNTLVFYESLRARGRFCVCSLQHKQVLSPSLYAFALLSMLFYNLHCSLQSSIFTTCL